jgi:hypothetical protein
MRSDWFLHNWMYAGFLAGLFLLAALIAPIDIPAIQLGWMSASARAS